MGTIDSHHLGKIMDKNTIKKLTYLSKLSIPESDIDELSKNLDNKKFVLAVLLDVRKCFDVVSHEILLKKLEKIIYEK